MRALVSSSSFISNRAKTISTVMIIGISICRFTMSSSFVSSSGGALGQLTKDPQVSFIRSTKINTGPTLVTSGIVPQSRPSWIVVNMGKRSDRKKQKAARNKGGGSDKEDGDKFSSSESGVSMPAATPADDAQSKSETGFSILGSAEPVVARDGSSKGMGFGASPSSKQVDEAYQKALEKIKGQEGVGKSRSPIFASKENDPTQPDKVAVRSVDIFDFLPESVQSTFETTLIAGLAINLLVIVALGTGFAVQALPTSNAQLPTALLDLSKTVAPFVDKYESYFTPSLGVFFLLSTILGSFKVAQLGRGGTEYREK